MEELKIHETTVGRQGLEAAQRLQPPPVLSDMMMPGGLDSLQICECIRAEARLKRTSWSC